MTNQSPRRRIEELEDTLYQRGPASDIRSRHHVHSTPTEIPTGWHHDDASALPAAAHTHSKFIRNIFLCALAFCLLAGGFMLISLTRARSSVSNENITLDVNAKSFIDGGEDIGYRLTITNGNAVPLELVDLVIAYPTTATATLGHGTAHVREPIGTILPRQKVTKAFDIVLYGQEGDERDIQTSLEYRIPGSNAIFVKDNSFRVGIRSSPISITMMAPDAVVANQPIEITTQLNSHALELMPDMALRLEYPSGFQFESAEPAPSEGNSLWVLGDVTPGEQRVITIKGFLAGQSGSQKTITAQVGTLTDIHNEALDTILASLARVITLQSPFIDATLRINNEETETVILDESSTIRATIVWTNRLPTRVNDVRLGTTLTGELFDPTSVRVQDGRYDSNTNTIVWNQDTMRELALVEPGQTGSVSFSFDIKPLVNTAGSSVIRSPELQVSVDMRATGLDGKIYQAQKVDTSTVRFNSTATVEKKTLHSSGPVANSGPIPPKVGQATTYTLHWQIRNTSNALSDARITTTLPTGVTWLGVTSPNTQKVTYNNESRLIAWDIGSVPAGTGFGGAPREVYIQLAITPSSSEAGSLRSLSTDVVFSATDTFTGQQLTTRTPGHTTQLQGDTIEDGGIVTP